MMDLKTFQRRKTELFVKYSDLYDEMKKNGASFAERKEVALKLQLLKDMKQPQEIPPFDHTGFRKLYRDTATLIWFSLPKDQLKDFAHMVKNTLNNLDESTRN